MQIKRIRCRNIFSIQEEWLEFAFKDKDKILFLGENGAGKSILFELLCLLFYKRTFRNISRISDIINDRDEWGTDGPRCAEIEIVFTKGNDTYEIYRKINKSGRSNELTIKRNNEYYSEAHRNDLSQEYIIDTILGGMTFENFKALLVTTISDDSFMEGEKNVVRNVVYKLCNLSYADKKAFFANEIKSVKSELEPMTVEEREILGVIERLEPHKKGAITKTILDVIGKEKRKLNKLYKKMHPLMEELDDLEIIYDMLKPNGIISREMMEYLPDINFRMQKYLKYLTQDKKKNISFALTNTIESDVSEGKRKSTSYSRGEQLVINIAILLAFKELQKHNNKIDFDAIIFDETVNSSLDDLGVNNFFNLIKKLDMGTIFVITHKPEMIFQDHIFSKIYHFSIDNDTKKTTVKLLEEEERNKMKTEVIDRTNSKAEFWEKKSS